jgi:hypothetical protein
MTLAQHFRTILIGVVLGMVSFVAIGFMSLVVA